jgi:hypothetical protein
MAWLYRGRSSSVECGRLAATAAATRSSNQPTNNFYYFVRVIVCVCVCRFLFFFIFSGVLGEDLEEISNKKKVKKDLHECRLQQ